MDVPTATAPLEAIDKGTTTQLENSPLQTEHLSRCEPRKRTTRPTPECSPSIRSPVPKKITRRARTAKEKGSTHYHNPVCASPRRTLFFASSTDAANPLQGISMNHYRALRNNYTISHFHNSHTETLELLNLRRMCFMYMLMTSDHAIEHVQTGSFLTFLSRMSSIVVLPSQYVYLDVLDQNADSRETINNVLSGLHKQFGIGASRDHLVVAGDAKTYHHLQSLKLDYGEELSWLLPFPGDFHILKNFQPVLSKVYYDIGLKQLAMASGFRGETLTALQKCSHFKRTHNFILQSWEAIYMHMLNTFPTRNPTVADVIQELHEQSACTSLPSLFQTMRVKIADVQSLFTSFVQIMAESDPNWKFWNEYVSLNALSYIALFASIRSGNWALRLASIKLMAPIFSAFDRPTYRKLIPQHLADCLLLPSNIQESFAKGGFVVSITVLFDDPGRFDMHPKDIERNRRDAGKQSALHEHIHFDDRTKIPSKWRDMLGCRKCKRDLVEYVGDCFLLPGI